MIAPLIFQLIALKNVREAPGHDLVVAQLENLVPALVAYFSANAIDGGFTAAIKMVSFCPG